MTPPRRALVSLVVGAFGVATLVLVLRGPKSPLDGAAQWVRDNARPGDVVVAVGCAAPSDAARFAPARAVCADARVLPLAPLARFPRVLVAGTTRTLDRVLAARFGPPTRAGAGVRAFRPSPVLLDLRASIDRATVTRGGTVCPRRGKRHVCAGAAWRTVEAREVSVGDQPIECVFAHPSEDGLAIELPLPQGVLRLRGVAGLSDRAAARPRGPPVTLRVLVDERPVARAVVPNRKGLVEWSAPLPERASTLRLELATSSQGSRSLCLAAWGN